MNLTGIELREGSATQEDINGHLIRCDGNFSPRLSLKVDIGAYSRKIGATAHTFEAWSDGVLVGLVAAYLNDQEQRTGFITNVSVVSAFMRRGVASALLNRCVERARQEGIETIKLEVNQESREAIRLYEKLGFSEVARKDGAVSMRLTIFGAQGS